MFESIIRFSLANKLVVLLGVLAMAIFGVFSATQIPLDAVPDITNNQVQIVSVAPTFAPEEVEQLITYPLEARMTNIPDVEEVRSISRYGLSVITIVFAESIETLVARQFVQEQLNIASGELPPAVETELMPITTGLGEIYQYVLTVDAAHAHQYDATELRTIQDWIVKRQLSGTEGIIEVSSFGGYLKQYEVSIDPARLRMYNQGVKDVIRALEQNNENSGGSYLENGPYSYYLRTEGRVQTAEQIENIPLGNITGSPLRVRDVAEVTIGSAKRYGAMTMDGKGEVVGGITLMLKGANSSQALRNVEERINIIKSSLPEGVDIYPYLDRAALIGRTIATVKNNLIEGGLIVIIVLLLLLGNLRAGLIVASVIPLSMLFALIAMRYFGISANLMSLGAIDFGIVIDGAVIIMEGLLHTLVAGYVGLQLSQQKMDEVVRTSSTRIYRSAAFGVLIILVVFLPILSLEGVEGKTFRPMAQVVGLAVLGSLFLSVTYVPVMASLFLSKKIEPETGISTRIMQFLEQRYRPILGWSLRQPFIVLGLATVAFILSLFVFSRMGAEFIPTLEEGDIAMQQAIKPGSSLQESIRTATIAERILLDNFPEVKHVVSKIGTAEVPTDPMAIEDADIMIILKDKADWSSATTTAELMAKMKEKLAPISWASYEFTQPIQLRFNELMTGAKSDVSVKIFGETPAVLKQTADRAAAIIAEIDGAGDVKVDQTDGLRQLNIRYELDRMAQYGISVKEANQLLRAAYAGELVGAMYEEERKFDLVVRLDKRFRKDLDLSQLTLETRNGNLVSFSEVATIENRESPMLISREKARRFINIGINVRDRDVASLVADIQNQLADQLELPPGYEIQYGGTFENLRSARQRLIIAVPVALLLILLLLYLAFSSVQDALTIFVAVPLSAIGGVLALWLRDMPFSISSGIGFIALFGIAVLNGIVMISAIRQLGQEASGTLKDIILRSATTRLRPVLMTAAVAAFGFLPMALSTGSGAEVQRPLATVVIGGLFSSTLLTLVVLPALFWLINKKKFAGAKMASLIGLCLVCLTTQELNAQTIDNFSELLAYSMEHNPAYVNQQLDVNIIALERNAINQWAPLEIDYQGGQINTGVFDHQLNVRQNLNHLWGRKQRNALVDARLNEAETNELLLRHQLAYQLATVYDEWRHQLALLELQDSVLARYDKLAIQLHTRRKAGTLSVVDEELFKQRNRREQRQHSSIQSRVASLENQLRRLAYLSPDQRLRPNPLDQLPAIPMVLDTTTLQQAHWRAQLNLLAREQSLSRQLGGQPQLSLGYFFQSLDLEWIFQGVAVGASLPLDQRSRKSRESQLQLQMEQLANRQNAYDRHQQDVINNLTESIDQLYEALNAVDVEAVSGQQRLLNTLDYQLRNGAIDMLTFNRITETLFDEQRARLEQIFQLQQLIRERAFLSQKTF